MMMTSKAFLIRFLVCANLAAIVLAGLLIINNSQSTSHHDKPQDYIFDTSPTLHQEDKAWFSSHKDIEGKQRLAGIIRGGGRQLFSRVVGSLWRSVSEKEPCDFKGAEGIPRHRLLEKFVECYKEMSSMKNAGSDDGLQRSSNYSRRLMRGYILSTPRKLLEGSSATAAKMVDKSTTQDNKIEAAFHIDYSGPKTHPPKNN